MATHTLFADTRMEDLALASGDTIALNGHVLICESDLSAITGLYATGTGTIRLLSGGCADFSGGAMPNTITIEGGTEQSPLPAHRDAESLADNYEGRASACLYMPNAVFSGSIASHCVGNDDRQQYAFVVSSTSSTIEIDRDMDLEPGDCIGWTNSSPTDGARPSLVVSGYESRTITHSSGATVPVGSLIILVTCSFAVGCKNAPGNMFSINGNASVSPQIRGDEIGFFTRIAADILRYGVSFDVDRIVLLPSKDGCDYFQASSVIANNSCGRVGTLCTTAMILPNRISQDYPAPSVVPTGPIEIGRAYGQGFASLWGPNLMLIYSNFICRGGAIASPINNAARCELVDMELPQIINQKIAASSELVIRTTSPETCVIHRAGGIATLVRKGGGDAVMAQASVANAYQLVPTGADAVWHDQAVTVEAGTRLTVAWRAFCSIGAVGGVQILADSPLFGQVAVPMGTADVLAEYTESSPPLGVWGPSRLLSWRNTSGQPVRVWVRGWGQGGAAYSSVQVVKGGAL